MRLRDIPAILRTALREQWESPEQMWEAMAFHVGCTVERMQELASQFAFPVPFDDEGQWLGLPTKKSCRLCAQKPVTHGEELCEQHFYHQKNYGIFGEWQYHRLCKEDLDRHAKPEIDKNNIPRCPRCQKSLLVIPPDAIYKMRKRKRLNRKIAKLSIRNPAELRPGQMFRVLQEKKKADAPIRDPRKRRPGPAAKNPAQGEAEAFVDSSWDQYGQ